MKSKKVQTNRKNIMPAAMSDSDSSPDHELTQNSILRISDAKTLQLIELYKSEPCLWKTTDEFYRIRRKRVEAAVRIARKLHVQNFTAKHVMIKFKNLRNFFCQELKKIRKSVELGEREIYAPKVFWFSKMDAFLRPHLQMQTDVGNLPTSTLPPLAENDSKILHEETVIKDEEQEENEEINFEPEYAEDTLEEDSQTADWMPVVSNLKSIAEDDTGKIPAQKKPTLAKRIKKPNLHSSMKYRPVVQHQCLERGKAGLMLQSISRYLEQLTRRNEDAFDCFGKYVATMLRAMPGSHARALQPRIVQLLTSPPGDAWRGERVSQSD